MFFHYDCFTLNLNQIVHIIWDESEVQKCANVTMTNGEQFDIDGEYYKLFEKAVGRK
jgi:hypothetical protein